MTLFNGSRATMIPSGALCWRRWGKLTSREWLEAQEQEEWLNAAYLLGSLSIISIHKKNRQSAAFQLARAECAHALCIFSGHVSFWFIYSPNESFSPKHVRITCLGAEGQASRLSITAKETTKGE